MAAHPLRLPTEQECERFRLDGAVALKGVYQEDWVDLLRQGVERAMETTGPYTRRIQDEGDPAFFTDYVASDRVPELRRFALEGPAAELSANLMKSRRANFLFDGIFVKEPGATKKSTWHQDQPYYCVAGRQIVVLWAPLDPVPADVCLNCVKGSHLWGTAFRPVRFRDGADFGRGRDDGYHDPPDVDGAYAERILAWDLEPGDVIAFHGMTIHGAPGNAQASRRRRATNSTWVGDDSVYVRHAGVMEPDFPDCGLAPGDPLDCARFPRVYDAGLERRSPVSPD